MIVKTIRHSDGRRIGQASGSHLDGSLWASTQQVVADEFGCAPDDVGLLEVTEGENEGMEMVIVDGEVVGFISLETDEKRSRMTFQFPIAAE